MNSAKNKIGTPNIFLKNSGANVHFLQNVFYVALLKKKSKNRYTLLKIGTPFRVLGTPLGTPFYQPRKCK